MVVQGFLFFIQKMWSIICCACHNKDNQTPINQVSGCNNDVHQNGGYGCGDVEGRFKILPIKGEIYDMHACIHVGDLIQKEL